LPSGPEALLGRRPKRGNSSLCKWFGMLTILSASKEGERRGLVIGVHAIVDWLVRFFMISFKESQTIMSSISTGIQPFPPKITDEKAEV
jgi:hypothetical protein